LLANEEKVNITKQKKKKNNNKGGYVESGCELTREIKRNGITALSLTFLQTQLQLLKGVTKRNREEEEC